MTGNEIITKIEALNEWEALMEEAKAEIEALRDSIKAEMLDIEGMDADKILSETIDKISNMFL